MPASSRSRVTIVGLGLHGGGLATAQYFAKTGADIVVTDLRDHNALAQSLKQLAPYDITYVLGEHRYQDFEHRDLIVRNPGVPPDSPYILHAQKQGIPVLTDAALFMQETKAFVIGVTGTKGKSTCTALIASAISVALNKKVPPVSIPGGMAFLEALEQELPLLVAEFSSWDLESVAETERSPQIAVITSFFPDHLSRHKTMEAYAEAKSAIVQFQQEHDAVLYPEHDIAAGAIAKMSPGNVLPITAQDVERLPDDLALKGEHQRMNAALAKQAATQALAHPDFPFPVATGADRAIPSAIAAFPGLPGRYELIGTFAGRPCINDTTATNPGAAAAAIRATQKPMVLIAGGDGKDLSFDELAKTITERVDHVVLLPGSAADTLAELLKKAGFDAVTAGIMGMKEAVAAAWEHAAEGTTILLAPGASSLNAFLNEFERGRQFGDAVRTISHERS